MNESNNTNTEPTIIVDLYKEEETQAQRAVTKPIRKRGRPEKVSKDVFTEAWNNCSSLKEVAELLGVPALSASVKASNLRKSGRHLKLYKRGAKRKTACIASQVARCNRGCEGMGTDPSPLPGIYVPPGGWAVKNCASYVHDAAVNFGDLEK